MDALINVLKDHQIGTWCKRAAWVILIIDLFEVVFNSYTFSHQFPPGSQPLSLIQILSFGLAGLPSILFYFFILYAVGAVVNHFIRNEEVDDEADEDQDSTLPGEEVTSDQRR